VEWDIGRYWIALEARGLTSQENLEMHHVRTQFEELASADEDRVFDKNRRDFARDLQLKYPDVDSFLLYHILIGSTPSKLCSHFDFPSEHSVRDFFRNAINNYRIKLL